MLSRAPSRGFTLIEMVIAMAIVGLLLVAGLPIFKSWSQNMQIRAAAEATLNGLQYARNEALRRNTTVRFQLMSSVDNSCALSTGQSSWVVNLGASGVNDPSGACAATIYPDVSQSSPSSYNPYLLRVYDGSNMGKVTVTSTGTSANMLVIFNQFGQVQSPTTDTTWVFSNPSAGTCATNGSSTGVVCMNVVATANGRIRMCNPILASGSPQGC